MPATFRATAADISLSDTFGFSYRFSSRAAPPEGSEIHLRRPSQVTGGEVDGRLLIAPKLRPAGTVVFVFFITMNTLI